MKRFLAQKELFNSECCGDSKLILKGLDYKDFIVLFVFVTENVPAVSFCSHL